MSTKNIMLGGTAIIAILLMGVLMVTATVVQFSVSEEEAVNIATSAVAGTVQEVELESNQIYEVDIEKDGKEFEVSVDANTGEVRDDRKHQSMLEDYWLPRREGGRGTEITTLPGGEV